METELRLQLELEKMKLEAKREDSERRDREHQREVLESRERESREQSAAHQRLLELNAQQQAANANNIAIASMAQTAVTANTAMSTAAHHGGATAVNATATYNVQPTVYVQPTAYVTSTTTQHYCGPISWLIGIFLFPCICCCPVDTRQVPGVTYAVPGGGSASPMGYPQQTIVMGPPTPTYQPGTPTKPAVGYPSAPAYSPSY